MSTFKAIVLEHQKKKDDTWNVKIRLTHKREVKYIDTPIFVVKGQLNKKFEIKDDYILDIINEMLKKYRTEVASLGMEVFSYTCLELKKHLENKFESKPVDTIDFIEFAKSFVEKIAKEGRDSAAIVYRAIINSIVDYFDREVVLISEINYKFLVAWEAYLKTERTMIRKDQHGIDRTFKMKPSSDSGVFHYMRYLRTLFNEAIREFNDEDENKIVIKHYPFRKYKIGNAPKTKKRNLQKEDLNQIIDFETEDLKGTASLARDVATLCFYFIGMNTADIYHINNIADGRISYNRKKTRAKRSDGAFISIKIEPEAIPLIDKYKDESGERVFNFYKRYSDQRNFLKAVNTGLKQIAKELELEKSPTSVYFRHTWATIARNKCDIDKDVIAKALNHIDSIGVITDVYIDIDWSIIDDANRKVLDYIKK